MRTRYPPLMAVLVFDAAARHLSFTKAGEELLLAQSTVSHHVRALETYLGTALFRRKTRALELTADGEQFAATAREMLDVLAAGSARVRRSGGKNTLKVALLASFATHWLVPRLARFTALHPDIEVRLDASIAHADIAAGDADLGIRYGMGGWPGLTSKLLFAEWLTPVCSPRLLHEAAIVKPSDLARHTLLLTHSKMQFEWTRWGAMTGFDFAGARQLMLHDYNIALEAAIAGQGVLMGRQRLIGKALRDGVLVAPLGHHLVADGEVGYWLVTRTGRQPARASAFARWIASEAELE